MPKRKAKRVNPRRIPMAKSQFDSSAVTMEVSYGNRYFGWLLVLHAMLEQGVKTAEEIKDIWNTSEDSVLHLKLEQWERDEATTLMGLKEPYPNLNLHKVKSEAEAEVYRRKAKKNAIYYALCSISLGLKATGLVSDAEQQRIFPNVALTLAEIESGCNSYDQLAAEIRRHGLSLEQTDEDIFLAIIGKDGVSSGNSESF